MRRTLLTCLLVASVAALATAQGEGLYFADTYVERELPAGLDDVAAAATVVNPTDVDVEAVWIREVNDLPQGWRSGVCDTNDCYVELGDSAFFTIPARGSAPIVPHVYASRRLGDAQLSIRVVNLADREDDAMATFRFTETQPRPVSTSGTRLYPNPGAETFRVSSDVPLARITLTNMLGKVVRSFAVTDDSYDVRDLPNGIYLATLTGADGQVVKTLRYSKRAVGP